MDKYLSRHNVVFHNGLTKRQCGIFGTGKLGVCIWTENTDLLLQITNVDASPQSQMSSGILRISGIDCDKYLAKLILVDGVFLIHYDNGIKVELYGGRGDEFFYIGISGLSGETDIKVSLEGWDTEELANPFNLSFRYIRMVKRSSDWQTFDFLYSDVALYMSRGSSSKFGEQGVDLYEDIADETIFGYTLGVGAQKGKANLEKNSLHISGKQICLKVVNPSRFADKDTVRAARKLLEVKQEGEKESCTRFWNNFWKKSYVIYHSKDDDYLENIYYISRYVLACGMMGQYPMHFITGVFRNDGDYGIAWAVAYWWYNQRCLYAPVLAAGDWQFMKTQLDWYYSLLPKMTEDTRKKYPNSKGTLVAETLCWDGRRSFCENSEGAVVAEFIHCTGIEIALKMYDYCMYTGDWEYLNNQFLEFAVKSVDFIISHDLVKNADGKYEIPAGIANARESYVKIGNPITELGALRAILPKIIHVMQENGQSAETYAEVLKNLIDFRIGGYPKRFEMGVGGFDYKRTNWDDPCMELVYPFNIVGSGKPYYNEAVNNYACRIGRDSVMKVISWDNSAIWAARLGLSDEIIQNLSFQIGKTQEMYCGIGMDGNCKYEFTGNFMMAMQESFLQSYDGVIRVFPSVCQSEPNSVAAFKLFAKGGFLVESEFDFDNFQAKYVRITSMCGGVCKIFNPYGEGRKVFIKNEKTGEITEFSLETVMLETKRGDIFLLAHTKEYPEREAFETYANVGKKEFVFRNIQRQLGN